MYFLSRLNRNFDPSFTGSPEDEPFLIDSGDLRSCFPSPRLRIRGIREEAVDSSDDDGGGITFGMTFALAFSTREVSDADFAFTMGAPAAW